MSICNISKHYNSDDINRKESIDSSFFQDFWSRLEQHWNSGSDAENRFLQGESNTFVEFTDIGSIPDFQEVVRVVPEVEDNKECDTLLRYEYNLKLQRRNQKLSLLKKVPGQIASLLVVIFLALYDAYVSLEMNEN